MQRKKPPLHWQLAANHFPHLFSDQFIQTWSYIALFVVTFLSSSVVPLTSEFLLIAMQRLGYNVWLILFVASTGNFFGSLTTYWIGRYGGSRLMEKWIRPKPANLARAQSLYDKWGGPILFFSWIPSIGDALTFIAGVLKGDLRTFTFWVFLGKWVRFAVVLGLVSLIMSGFTA